MRTYPHSEARQREIDEAIELAKRCEHENTRIVHVAASLTSNGTYLDEEYVEVCRAKHCGVIVRSGL